MKHLLVLGLTTMVSGAPQHLVITTTPSPTSPTTISAKNTTDNLQSGAVTTISTTTIAPFTSRKTIATNSPNISIPSSIGESLATDSTTKRSLERATTPLEMTSFHVTSNIQFRYSRTVVQTRMSNPDSEAQMADFAVIIPDSAFVSNFTMTLENSEYVARVEEREKAEESFEKAVSGGEGAGLVRQSPRDTNRFSISANVEGGRDITFTLTYDELLERKDSMYEQTINIDLKQAVEDFKVEVFINESLPIKTIEVPELLESNEIAPKEDTENTIAVIERTFDGDDQKARILFAPSVEEQRGAAEQGVSGRLVVRYDVERQGQTNEVQVIDGYFVHFFVPENLKTLPKHAVFILDTSGSMTGEKLQQVKDAMFIVLDNLKQDDFFNIITFSSEVKHWGIETNTKEEEETPPKLEVLNIAKQKNLLPQPVPATENNKNRAIKDMLKLKAFGGTNINAAMLAGINLVGKTAESNVLPTGVASMLIFLSDGEATEGETSGAKIKKNIASANSDLKLPIFNVAFGRGADFSLLKQISAEADSFAKRVYEGSDAALQLETFYAEISSPLVTSLKFHYVGDLEENTTLSNTEVRTVFQGGQFVVTGKLPKTSEGLTVRVSGEKSGGTFNEEFQICLRSHELHDETKKKQSLVELGNKRCLPMGPPPRRSQAQEFLQSLYAFLNIKQLLKKDMKKEALVLAMQNNFVTPLTSLVVVRPGEEEGLASVEDPDEPRKEAPKVFLRSSAGGLRFKSQPSPRRPVSLVSSRRRVAPRPASLPKLPTRKTSSQQNSSEVQSPCSGALTLYSSTYHRGKSITLTKDSLDLEKFSKEAVSAVVEGSCCWVVYAEPSHRGASQTLRPGKEYRGTDTFGDELFREVSSVHKIDC